MRKGKGFQEDSGVSQNHKLEQAKTHAGGLPTLGRKAYHSTENPEIFQEGKLGLQVR